MAADLTLLSRRSKLGSMSERAIACPAKINLTLHVLGRRADGFHELDSLVAQVSLCDRLHLRETDSAGVTLTCDDPTIPCDASNLVIRAADCLEALRATRSSTGPAAPRGLAFHLGKRIPAGAGLGGGSSNAAATLRLLNELWSMRLADPALAACGASLGADVPLFLHSPLARMRGRGERVDNLDVPIRGHVVLLLPPLQCATRDVYAAFRASGGPRARVSNEQVVQAMASQPLREVMSLLHNDLTEPAFQVCPALRELWQDVTREHPGPLAMSGSGSTLFRLFDGPDEAADFARRVRAKHAIRVETVEFLAAPTTLESPP